MPTIPTASLADVGFLLLVFFLVATVIGVERGLSVTLPPDLTHEGLSSRPGTLLSVDVRADGQVALNGEATSTEAVRAAVDGHVRLGERQRVALRASRATPYPAYVDALDAVLMGHRDAGVAPRLTLREPVP